MTRARERRRGGGGGGTERRRGPAAARPRRLPETAAATASAPMPLAVALPLLLLLCLSPLASGFQLARPASARRGGGGPPRRLATTQLPNLRMSSPQFYDDFGDSFFEEQQQQSRREQREQRGDGGGGSGEEGEGEDEGLLSDSEDEDEGEYLNADSLGDWRELRRRLQDQSQQQQQQQSPSSSKKTRGRASNGKAGSAAAKISGEDENAALLETQCEELAREYRERAWAHPTPTPEVGGLVVRMPLEYEIFRGFVRRDSDGDDGDQEEEGKGPADGRRLRRPGRRPLALVLRTGEILRSKHGLRGDEAPGVWHPAARRLVERSMLKIAHLASQQDGQVDASQLDGAGRELLQLYLDHQETWQEVCLVLSSDQRRRRGSGGSKKGRPSSSAASAASSTTTTTTTTLVLNRPMALKLTPNLARLVLYGSPREDGGRAGGGGGGESSYSDDPRLLPRFLEAFGPECAVYVGGPDDQDQPAEILHGIRGLEGSVEICPHAGIYVGGLRAAIAGVLEGKHKPMDFRFFVGRHQYEAGGDGDSPQEDEEEAALPLHAQVLLGKYQPIACSRSLVLKQCISLPKPLWHEVMDMAGGELAEISRLELGKQGRVRFQILDDEDDDEAEGASGDGGEGEGDDDDEEIVDELSELERFDDEDDDEP